MSNKSLTDVPETNHDAMRAAQQRPADGDRTTANQAAAGGTELPGREKPMGDPPVPDLDGQSIHEPIPGERDGDTLTHKERGSMSGRANGADAAPDGLEQTLDDDTRHDRELEGGGKR